MSRVPNATLGDRVDLRISKDCGLTCFPYPMRSLAISAALYWTTDKHDALSSPRPVHDWCFVSYPKPPLSEP